MKGVWAVYDEGPQEASAVPLLTAGQQQDDGSSMTEVPSHSSEPPSESRAGGHPADGTEAARQEGARNTGTALVEDEMEMDEKAKIPPPSGTPDTAMPDADPVEVKGESANVKDGNAANEPKAPNKEDSLKAEYQQQETCIPNGTGTDFSQPEVAQVSAAAAGVKHKPDSNQATGSDLKQVLPDAAGSAETEAARQQVATSLNEDKPVAEIHGDPASKHAGSQSTVQAAAPVSTTAASGPAASIEAAAAAGAPHEASSRPRKKRKLFHAYMFLSSSTGSSGLRGETKVMRLGEQLKEMSQSEVVSRDAATWSSTQHVGYTLCACLIHTVCMIWCRRRNRRPICGLRD